MEILVYGLILLCVCAFVGCLITMDHYKNEVQYYKELNRLTIEANKKERNKNV